MPIPASPVSTTVRPARRTLSCQAERRRCNSTSRPINGRRASAAAKRAADRSSPVARQIGTGETFLEAIVNLTLRNTRRYGGYIVHFGFVLLFIGLIGQAFTTDAEGEMGIGDTISIREYTLRMEKLGVEETPNYGTSKATVGLFDQFGPLPIRPCHGVCWAPRQPGGEQDPSDPALGQARERRAVLHAHERILGQSDRGAVRSGTHLCHGRLGPPESPRAGPQAAGLPALA